MNGMGNEEVEEAIPLPTLLAMIGFFGLVVFGVLALRPVTNDVRPFNDEILRGRRAV